MCKMNKNNLSHVKIQEFIKFNDMSINQLGMYAEGSMDENEFLYNEKNLDLKVTKMQYMQRYEHLEDDAHGYDRSGIFHITMEKENSNAHKTKRRKYRIDSTNQNSYQFECNGVITDLSEFLQDSQLSTIVIENCYNDQIESIDFCMFVFNDSPQRMELVVLNTLLGIGIENFEVNTLIDTEIENLGSEEQQYTMSMLT